MNELLLFLTHWLFMFNKVFVQMGYYNIRSFSSHVLLIKRPHTALWTSTERVGGHPATWHFIPTIRCFFFFRAGSQRAPNYLMYMMRHISKLALNVWQ